MTFFFRMAEEHLTVRMECRFIHLVCIAALFLLTYNEVNGRIKFPLAKQHQRAVRKSQQNDHRIIYNTLEKLDNGNVISGKQNDEKKDCGKQDDGRKNCGNQDDGRKDCGKQDDGKKDCGKQDDGSLGYGKLDNEKGENINLVERKENGKKVNRKQDNKLQDKEKQNNEILSSEKQDSGNLDNGKQDNGKQDNGKQDNGKQDNEKQENGKQKSGKQGNGKERAALTDAGGATKEAMMDKFKIRRFMKEAIRHEKIREKWNELTKADKATKIPAPIKEKLGKSLPRIIISKSKRMTLSDVFHYLENYPVLYGVKEDPIRFTIPIDGKTIRINLQNKPGEPGKFIAYNVYRDPKGTYRTTDLFARDKVIPLGGLDEKTEVHDVLKSTIETAIPTIFKSNLDIIGKFEKELKKNEGTDFKVPDDEKKKAFREAVEFSAMSIFTRKYAAVAGDDKHWYNDIRKKLLDQNEEAEKRLNEAIKEDVNTKIKYELTSNMLQTSEQIKERWATLVKDNVIEETRGDKGLSEVKFIKTDKITLREIFKQLQYFIHIHEDSIGRREIKITIPIGQKNRVFRLQRAAWGKHQLTVKVNNEDFPGTSGARAASYTDLLKIFGSFSTDEEKMKELKEKIDKESDSEKKKEHEEDYNNQVKADQKKLAKALLDACESSLRKQPDFEKLLKVTVAKADKMTGEEREKADTKETTKIIRAAVEFLAITMIAEAAQPSDERKKQFLTEIAEIIQEKQRFPVQAEMPKLELEGKKEGRTPGMDQIAIQLLREVYNTGVGIHKVFTRENYPALAEHGTALARKHVYNSGDDTVESYVLREEIDGDHDLEVVAKEARLAALAACTSKPDRLSKRAICDLEELDDKIMVDETSIQVKDDKVTVRIVDRRDATKTIKLSIPVSQDELATPKRIKESISQSRRSGTTKKYANIHKGLAIHGMIFSTLGAIDYFSRGDNVRGGIAVSQSLHTLGGLTGLNEIAAKAGKQLLRYGAFKLARGLDMEKGLARFGQKVDKFMEKGVGKLMGDIPGVGLAFDVYFIGQDIEALSKLNLNDPADVKMLPLRIVDLALDVDTTVLNLIGTFCPEAEVITEPLVIVLSIIRMGIDDFYVDIMSEMDKVNWKSPWAGLEFIGALAKGIVEGAADFLSGGLLREMKSYKQQEEADKEVVAQSRNPDNYFKIQGNKANGETINLNEGSFSSFAGFINFRLSDDGHATLEIGDVRGSHKNIKKTFEVDKELDSIVLGIGESGDFKYKTKTAYLWFFIPVKHYRIICGAKLKSSSLYGTYYGNSRNNKFVAVQNQKQPAKPDDSSECDYGKMDLKFVLGNYHYNLYGRGGNDIFYLGPQMSKVTGGEGADVYIIQSDGGRTVIDNFAEDKKHDMVAINVRYRDIRCKKSDNNLDVTYSSTHHIRINNWFPEDSDYYRHVSFRSADGVIFVPKTVTPSSISNATTNIHCNPVAIDKSAEKAGESLSLESPEFANVKQWVGSENDDVIIGNDVNNILEGGKGEDHLTGGKNEDTYIIRANEGCDTINNDADDFAKSTDVVVFDVPYDSINARAENDHLFVYKRDNEHTSCFTIKHWFLGERYQHMTFTSSDHVVFTIQTEDQNSTPKKIAMMLDYSSGKQGKNVDLSKPEFSKVATVLDSPQNDTILGNSQSNFLSCTKGDDLLRGRGGSDNYVVKQTCTKATIRNLDRQEKVDLLLIEEDFENLKLNKHLGDLQISSPTKKPFVVIKTWFRGSRFQHIWIRTRDGVTAKIGSRNGNLTLIPVEISKDPVQCKPCMRRNCKKKVLKYNLSKKPWKEVTRFQLKSSHCSYNIRGNNLNNYIDPGSSNGYNTQYIKGGNGSDTYVFKHGYGEYNKINNHARDQKDDTLQLGLDLQDIKLYFYKRNDVIITSRSRPSSLRVQLVDYFKNLNHQHLKVVTSDKIVFEITRQQPLIKVLSIDRSISDSSQTISGEEDVLLASAQSIQGSLSYPNKLSGTIDTRELSGGSQEDIITGGDGKNIIRGREGDDELNGEGGNDIIFGGNGNDCISGGKGHDYIYGGSGQDEIDGGTGSDTLAFKGDGFEKKGVYIDLAFGFGKGADAEGDKYKSIENVYGSIHDDILIGSDSNNNLYGSHGNDTIIVNGGGNDKLVGGWGNDRYIFDKAYGIKVIDNYADDCAEDTLSLTSINENQACFFLIGNDLYMQITKNTISSILYQTGQNLTIVVPNWSEGIKYRHLKVVFNDTVWSNDILTKVENELPQMGTFVSDIIGINSNFQIKDFNRSSVKLSWRPISKSILDENTKLYLMKMDVGNPIDMEITQLRGQQSEILVDSLGPTKHYLFALFLEKCSVNIATSTTLMTFGQRAACPAVTPANYQAIFDPQRSLSHGTTIRITCDDGYTLDGENEAICIDGQWKPTLPTCRAIIRCSKLKRPGHGSVTMKGRRQGSIARYVCKRGFQLDGALERICQADETWKGEEPQCLPMKCGKPPEIEHGKLETCVAEDHSANVHETFSDPREGSCAKLKCDTGYVESYRLDNQRRLRRSQRNDIPYGVLVCKDGIWIGYRRSSCEPGVRMKVEHETWFFESGKIEIWKDGYWDSVFDENKIISPSIACSNLANDYNVANIPVTKPIPPNSPAGVLEMRITSIGITCPKIRFVNGATKYEGHLEVIVKKEWQTLCYSNYVTTDYLRETVELCKGIDSKMTVTKPSLVARDMGTTKYRLSCSAHLKTIHQCTVVRHEQQCKMMLRCRQRCPNKYPAPNGKVTCTEQRENYEGDSCEVDCKMNFELEGPQTVKCLSGVWIDPTTGKPGVTNCVENKK